MSVYTDWEDLEPIPASQIPLWEHDAFYEEVVEPKGGLHPLADPPDYYPSTEPAQWGHDSFYEEFIEPRQKP